MTQDSNQIKTALRDAQLQLTLRIFLICSIILAVLYAFAFIDSLIAMHNGDGIRAHIEDLLSFPAYLLMIWGLKHRRKWAPPLICGVACFSMLNMLVATVSGGLQHAAANPIAMLFIYLFNGLFIIFFAYQLYFFARKDVREFFRQDSAHTANPESQT